eukprot:Hpha_TRINITY_DN26090_c0_g1::TRINITY_DN26090_c0_g1_i1::g.115267::m.115267/K18258/CRYM; thiomorpholine-carboxylate dehydrogenase
MAEGQRCPLVGLLTGISFQSGLDYYDKINKGYMEATPKGSLMPRNPRILMSSVDCNEYAEYLVARRWDKVQEYLSFGASHLARGGAEILLLCSNTAHLAAPRIQRDYPSMKILHIGDTTAAAIKAKGGKKVGLLGTEPTMRESYLKDRLREHGIETIVPDTDEDLHQIFQYIMKELGVGVFKESTRAYFVEQARKLVARGAEGVIMGCTEIELLMRQQDIPEVPLFPSADLHIEAGVLVASGKASIESFFPPSIRASPAAVPPASIISGQHLTALLPMPELVREMQGALAAVARGEGVVPLRTVVRIPGGEEDKFLAAMPSALGAFSCVKSITVFPGNSAREGVSAHQGVVSLFDAATDGRLLCVLDAHELTLRRTAAASAAATNILAPEGPCEMAVLGTGPQAAAHVEAILTIRPITAVHVWGRRADAAARVAEDISTRFKLPTTAHPTVEEAVKGAGIVCTLTSATAPILEGKWLAPGCHVNAVGCCTPKHRELDAEVVRGCEAWVDTREGCLKEAGDLLSAFREGVSEDHVKGEVGTLVGQKKQRPDGGKTLFKSVGFALEDLAAATLAYTRLSA